MTSASRGGRSLEHPLHFLGGDDRPRHPRGTVVDERAVGVGVTELLLAMAADQFLHAGPAGDHREVGRQRADPLEPPEDRIIVVHDLQEDLRGDVLDILGGQDAAPRVGGVLDDVVDQAHVAIDEVIPGTGLLPQATVEKVAIDVTQRHGPASSGRRRHDRRCRKIPVPGIRERNSLILARAGLSATACIRCKALRHRSYAPSVIVSSSCVEPAQDLCGGCRDPSLVSRKTIAPGGPAAGLVR